MDRSFRYAVAVLLGVIVVPAEGAALYSFVEIARGGSAGPSPFSQFQYGLGINSNGRAVFRGNLKPSGEEGLFTGAGGPTTTIATAGGLSNPQLFDPTIADDGTVLFRADYHVLGGSGGAFTTYAPPPGDPFIGPNWFGQVVNLNGTAVLSGGVTAATQLHLSSGAGGPSLLYDAATLAEIALFFSPDINESGTVAAIVGPGFGQPVELVVGSGGPLAKVVSSDDGLGNLYNVSINNTGQVGFSAADPDAGAIGPEGLYVSSIMGTPSIVADLAGPFSQFNNFGMSLNDAGSVAFWAQLDAGGEGIFTGPDPGTDKVIATGDPLLGSTVTGLHFERFSLNNSGQLVFLADLADGDQVIVRADVIPEPVAASLLALGGLAVLRRRRRRTAAASSRR